MRWFEPFTVSPDLRGVLEARYVATTAGRHDLIPDGCMDLLWTAAGRTVLCGPDTRAWSFELPVGTEVAGVRFRPGSASAVFRLDAATVVDQRIDLAALLGDAEARVVDERLAAADGPFGRLGVLEDLVRRRTRDADPDAGVRLAALVTSARVAGVDDLAEQSGVSGRQVRRRFDRTVGYGPAFLARIARLQRFARAAARSPGRSVAELAVFAGYVDQAHLAKDCRSIADVTPRELIAVLPRTSLAPTLGDLDVTRLGVATPAERSRSAA